jgi:hypothetical protein
MSRVINSRRISKCGMHVRDENVYTVFVGKPDVRDHLRDIGIEARIILK